MGLSKRIRPSFAAGALLVLLFSIPGCVGPASQPPQDAAKAAELDAFFLRFRRKVQERNADSLLRDLSRESLLWLRDMGQAARTEARVRLEERPFHEILCILGLRVERRLNPAFDDRPAGLMEKLVIQNHPVRKTLLKTELGNARARGETGEIGLRETPNVPVFFFTRGPGGWTFHLVRSLPLILQGAESLARSRKSTRLEQAVFILEQFAGRRVLPEDLIR